MISIIMGYYNRKEQLIRTLQSIVNSVIQDIEVILVDDCSCESERVEDLIPKFPFLKVKRVERLNKWYTNSCMPFNMGIASAKGDKLILQNPECLHIGDVLNYVDKNLTDDVYFAFSTYALNPEFYSLLSAKRLEEIPEWISLLPQKSFYDIGWYNHPIYNPTYYHFCAAITRSNMDKLGGFDERYAEGIAYDDNELVERVKRMPIKLEAPVDPLVVHQWHSKVNSYSFMDYKEKHFRNKVIFELLTSKEDSIYKPNRYRYEGT